VLKALLTRKKCFYPPNRAFCFMAPKIWEADYHPDFEHIVQASDPVNGASVTASGYAASADGSLKAFAKIRFSPESREPFLQQVGEVRDFPQGCYLETEGTCPGDEAPTCYVIGVVELPERAGYVSFSIVTSREEFELNRERYEAIMRSTRKG